MIRAGENPGLVCWWLAEWFVYNYPLAAAIELALGRVELEPAFVVGLALEQAESELAFVVESAELVELVEEQAGLAEEQAGMDPQGEPA